MSSQPKSWDQALLQQVRMFVPSEEFLSHGRNIANKLLIVLHKYSKFSIDRAGIMGSVEKKTSLSIDVDYDFVIFINNALPPFDEVFDDFEDVILPNLKNAKLSSYPKTRGSALKVTLDGLEFDIVPAVNFSQDPEVQQRCVMDVIRRLPRPATDGYRYSSSLSQTAVGFVKRQTPFAHDVMRLAKFWNKTIFITEGISGRSSLIELIATQVAKDEEQLNASASLFRAFTSFLGKMTNLITLKIIFYDYYTDSEINARIKHQRPLVLDPANPYNNFGYAFIRKPGLMDQFCKYAQTTLERLLEYHNNLLDGLVYVFEAQPRIAPRDLVMQYLPDNVDVGNSIMISVTKRNKDSFPHMIVHNERRVNNNKFGVEILKHYLLKNAQIMNDLNLPDTENSRKTIQSIVERVIDLNVLGKPYVRHWPPSNGPYNDDVTFEIPTGSALVTVHFKLGFLSRREQFRSRLISRTRRNTTRRDESETTTRDIFLYFLIFLLVIVVKRLDIFGKKNLL